MNTEDAQYLTDKINDEGFDYCFDGYSKWEEIKDIRFQELRKKYLDAKQALKWYIQVSLPNCGVPEGINIEEEMLKAWNEAVKEEQAKEINKIDIEAELWKALGESMKEAQKAEDLAFINALEEHYKGKV